ncbi:hypothetical protein ACFQ0X_12450 [Streptomyces rectiviolaceus]|uniref:Uncharacterized protein n=1 Tax=Streptomyces rectiviolaceus TaxID=332591 RepID=A0ABP6MVP6_9ACTN
MDSPQQAEDLREEEAEGNIVQDTFEALTMAFKGHGMTLPQMRVDWGPVEPQIHLGAVTLAEGHQLCRALGSEVR